MRARVIAAAVPLLMLVAANVNAYDYTIYSAAGCRPPFPTENISGWEINLLQTYNNSSTNTVMFFTCPVIRQNASAEPWTEIQLRVRDGNPGTDVQYDAVNVYTGIYNHSNQQGNVKFQGYTVGTGTFTIYLDPNSEPTGGFDSTAYYTLEINLPEDVAGYSPSAIYGYTVTEP